MRPADADRCPCGTGLAFGECCGPLLDGQRTAPTAVQLMRSRFTAFAIGDAGYLLDTWHASTRPRALELDPGLRWTRLDVDAIQAGGPLDREGEVEFTAYWRSGDGRRGSQHERSRFLRDGGRWRYLDAV